MSPTELSQTLEDYLETIYLLVRDKKVARVRDIAAARGVKPGSVTPAMRRLASLGLIDYERREYIDLTPEGEVVARRTLARHQLLRRFLVDVLRVDEAVAAEDACAMEHHLSDQSMEKLSRFFEFIHDLPDMDFVERFHHCPRVNAELPPDPELCGSSEHSCCEWALREEHALSQITPGRTVRVVRIDVDGEGARTRLLNTGLLPDVAVEVLQNRAEVDHVLVQLGGYEVEIPRRDASLVLVR